MARSLKSFNNKDRQEAINRRILSGTRGNGYWASVDAFRKMKKAEGLKGYQINEQLRQMGVK